MTTALLPETRFSVDLEPLGNPAGRPVALPVFARTASAAGRIAQQVFPRGMSRVLAVRDGARVVWEPPNHNVLE